MKKPRVGRRDFLRGIAGSAAAVPFMSPEALGFDVHGRSVRIERARQTAGEAKKTAPTIRFAVIGINHGHINGQTNAMLRARGELVSMYAKEDDLKAAFLKTFPQHVGRERQRAGRTGNASGDIEERRIG